ncbi:hypothetical protein [Trichormus azollae]|uniref:hypothetical protein n=1 Tax=Trichormus azollae TaxID=1164 RepID=UPI001E363EA3|nr:hypothetical protein [Trichormus azollae]
MYASRFTKLGKLFNEYGLDDPSHILMDVDGCLQGLSDRSNCKDSGADLIHLRQINPVSICEMLLATNAVHLTVIKQFSARTH